MIQVISTILIAASLLIGNGSTEDKSAASAQPGSGQIITNDEVGM